MRFSEKKLFRVIKILAGSGHILNGMKKMSLNPELKFRVW